MAAGIGILLTSLSLLVSGASRPQDTNAGLGLRKLGIPDIKISAQISNADALDLARPDYTPDLYQRYHHLYTRISQE
jgi:hypothetical protein